MKRVDCTLVRRQTNSFSEDKSVDLTMFHGNANDIRKAVYNIWYCMLFNYILVNNEEEKYRYNRQVGIKNCIFLH